MGKKKIKHWALFGAFIAPWLMVTEIIRADNNPSRQEFLIKPEVSRASQISLQQAINIALGKHGGRVLSAQSKNDQGQRPPRHHIRLLLDGGRVLNVVVDDRGRVQRTR
tara:strand:- start:426 stop:752 length:327 start_codon:yes stop_codon:yes gene_type:complete